MSMLINSLRNLHTFYFLLNFFLEAPPQLTRVVLLFLGSRKSSNNMSTGGASLASDINNLSSGELRGFSDMAPIDEYKKDMDTDMDFEQEFPTVGTY